MEGMVVMSMEEHESLKVIESFIERLISREEAASKLGISERAVTRRANKIRLQGLNGAFHGNRGRKPKIKKSHTTKHRYLSKKREQYSDFNVCHAWEMIRNEAGENELEKVSRPTFYRWCKEAGLLKHARRRLRKPRKLRERMPMKGMMIQLDGSHHKWNGEEEWCLISAIDDASSELVAARFFRGETTLACLQVLHDIIKRVGVPKTFYIDRAHWGGGAKRQLFSHFETACKELDIRIIYANSPEAKGRIERANRTHQDRLIPLLRLRKKTNIADANNYLENYLAEWNSKFIVEPTMAESQYRPYSETKSLKEIVCVKEHREVRADSAISFSNVIIEVKQQIGFGLGKGTRVEVRLYPDETWKVFYHEEPLKLKLAPKNRQPDHRYLQKLPPGNKELDLQVDALTNGTISLNS